MREVAHTALLSRSRWFGDLKLNDSKVVVTEFLRDWRAAQMRHDAGGRSIFAWAALWAIDHEARYQARYKYLEPDTPEGVRSG